jgi:hypothetical protein
MYGTTARARRDLVAAALGIMVGASTVGLTYLAVPGPVAYQACHSPSEDSTPDNCDFIPAQDGNGGSWQPRVQGVAK